MNTAQRKTIKENIQKVVQWDYGDVLIFLVSKYFSIVCYTENTPKYSCCF